MSQGTEELTGTVRPGIFGLRPPTRIFDESPLAAIVRQGGRREEATRS